MRRKKMKKRILVFAFLICIGIIGFSKEYYDSDIKNVASYYYSTGCVKVDHFDCDYATLVNKMDDGIRSTGPLRSRTTYKDKNLYMSKGEEDLLNYAIGDYNYEYRLKPGDCIRLTIFPYHSISKNDMVDVAVEIDRVGVKNSYDVLYHYIIVAIYNW